MSCSTEPSTAGTSGKLADATLKALEDYSAWAALLGPEPDAPEGALTVAEFAERFSLTIPTASGKLKRAFLAGEVERGHKRVVNSYGRSIVAVAYWPKVKPCTPTKSGAALRKKKAYPET